MEDAAAKRARVEDTTSKEAHAKNKNLSGEAHARSGCGPVGKVPWKDLEREPVWESISKLSPQRRGEQITAKSERLGTESAAAGSEPRAFQQGRGRVTATVGTEPPFLWSALS